MIFGETFTDFLVALLLVYYGFQSHKAIVAGAGGAQAAHWLTFWTLYGIFQAFEEILDYVLWRVPFYYELILAMYIWLGMFGGAQLVYEKFGKNAIKAAEAQAKQLSEKPQVKQVLQQVDAKLAPVYASIRPKAQ